MRREDVGPSPTLARPVLGTRSSLVYCVLAVASGMATIGDRASGTGGTRVQNSAVRRIRAGCGWVGRLAGVDRERC
jgi:hypothetical protein